MSDNRRIGIKRDLNVVLIAEDNKDISSRMRRALETVGGFNVWVTPRASNIMSMLASSNAAILILDIELEDTNSLDMIENIRMEYGKSVYILVLSGNWQEFPEKYVISKGANFMLRKPYEPEALLMQLHNIKELLAYEPSITNNVSSLEIGDFSIDLAYGLIRNKNEVDEKTLVHKHFKLFQLFANQWDCDKNKWRPITREYVILNIWGSDVVNSPDGGGARLRRNIFDIRNYFDVDPITILRGREHETRYAFSSEVKPVFDD